jgi:uncharacterized Zn-finger protein
MNFIRKSSISSIVNCNDDHKNFFLLAGVNQLLEAAEFLERQEKVEAFKIKSKSDATICFESAQTMVNDPKINDNDVSGTISTVYANPDLGDIIPETELGPEFTREQFDRLNYLYRNISSQGPFFCKVDGCDKEFKRKDNLKCHLKTHIPNRSRPFECQKCNRGYLRHVDLSRHIETVHLGVRKYFCQVCSKSFTRKEGLRIHSERCA